MAIPDVDSLTLRTDLRLLEQAGSEIEDLGTHLVVRTPDNPTFRWGNFLILRRPPFPGGAREVMAAFDAEFDHPGYRAITFDQTGPLDVSEFVEAQMTATRDIALIASSVQPPARAHAGAELRVLSSPEDWEQRVALSLRIDGGSEAEAAFARGKVRQEQRLEELGLGHRWGAFVDGRLVATAGIYRVADEVARFQSVETDPDHRRQGLAGTLVHRVAEHGFTALGATTLVIVADADAGSIRIYHALGFADAEVTTDLEQVRALGWSP